MGAKEKNNITINFQIYYNFFRKNKRRNTI